MDYWQVVVGVLITGGLASAAILFGGWFIDRE